MLRWHRYAPLRGNDAQMFSIVFLFTLSMVYAVDAIELLVEEFETGDLADYFASIQQAL